MYKKTSGVFAAKIYFYNVKNRSDITFLKPLEFRKSISKEIYQIFKGEYESMAEVSQS